MNRGTAKHIFRIFCALSVTPGLAPADTVVLEGPPPFRNVHIISFKQGRLHFRGVSNEVLRKPLGEITRFQIDRLPMLGNAEALAANNPRAALVAYRQALEDAGEPWLRDLIRVRLLSASDRAGEFDAAVTLFIELLREQPALAKGLAPRNPGPPGSTQNDSARRQLGDARQSISARAAIGPLRTLTLELLLYEEVDPLPAEFAPPASQSASDVSKPTPTTQPDPEPPLMFGPPGRHPAGTPPRDDEASGEGKPPRLPADSFILTGARRALEAGQVTRATSLLERALPYVPEDESYPWRLLLGRCRIELGQPARAADELVALSESAHDRALAGEALYYVGVAHERMDRADVAIGIYRELLQRDDLPAEIRRHAQRGLERLGE